LNTNIINTENLLNWFEKNKRHFPWNEDKNPYRVWISEIMLQQTVAASVIPYFKRWIIDYPDLQTLASAELNEVLSHWEGLGYYSRCRNLHKAADFIINEFNGVLPGTYRELKSIPGIGDYTARAILSIAFKKPYAVLDANVRRIVQRLASEIEWSKESDKLAIIELEKSIPPNRPGDFNEAMMQLGQQICITGEPKCMSCPLSENCQAFKKGIAHTIPEKRKKQIAVTEKTALIFCSQGKILLRRKKQGLFHDLWLLPTVLDDSSEGIRWMKTIWSRLESKILTKRNHFYTENKDIITPCLISSEEIDLTCMAPADDEFYEHKWIKTDNLEQYPSPSAYRKILNEAKEHL